MGKYKFNKEQLNFVEDKRGFKGWVKMLLRYFFMSILLAVFYYVVFTLFISTENERALERETRMLEEEYIKLSYRLDHLNNTVKNLQQRDREIYRSLFNAEPPNHSATGDYNMFEGIDTTRMEAIVEDSRMRLEVIEKGMNKVEEVIGEIKGSLDSLGSAITSIPSVIPVKDFGIRQSGASVGEKINPFYKTVTVHNGMDLNRLLLYWRS